MRIPRVVSRSPLAAVLVGVLLLWTVPAMPASATVTVTSHFIFTAPGNGTFAAGINNGATNGEGNALLFVTPNYSAGGVCGCVSDSVPIAVVYNLFGGARWAVINLDESTTIAAGSTYNVLVVQKSKPSVFVQTATTANTLGGATYINSTLTNGLPNAQILITPNYDPGGNNGVLNDHPVGAYYNPTLKEWGVLNEDGSSMTIGAHFNIMVGSKPSNGGRETLAQATSGDSAGSFVIVNNTDSNGNPNAAVFDTQNSDPGGTGGTFDTSVTGVEYFQSPTDDWAVFQEDNSSMALGTSFNVLAFSS
jgi:hypothetical protein